MAERLRQRFFGEQEHPYRTFEKTVTALLTPDSVLLDVGCGRTAPVLRQFVGKARRLIGIDLVDFSANIDGVELSHGDIARSGLSSDSVDVVMARSVMEHVPDPSAAFAEIGRVLRPGGSFVFLTANFWDYASLIANVVPNRWHPWIVARVEGRAEEDVFPIQYKCNTKRAILRLASRAGLHAAQVHYLGQYPAYFMFNGPLFLLGTAYEKLLERFRALHFLRGWILAVVSKPG
jgi:SAM-dependent methyltransferase